MGTVKHLHFLFISANTNTYLTPALPKNESYRLRWGTVTKRYESLLLLNTFLALVNCVLKTRTCKQVQNWKKRRLGRSDNTEQRYRILKYQKNAKKQRYGVATAQSVYGTAYGWYKFSFHSESDMSFSIRYICWLIHFHILGQNCQCRLCLAMQIQSMMFVTLTPKMLLWLHIAELINEKQGKSEGFESCDWPIVRKHPIWVKIGDVLYRVTSKFDGRPWKTIGHFSFAVSSFVQNHWWIQTGVTVRKRPLWVKFDDF